MDIKKATKSCKQRRNTLTCALSVQGVGEVSMVKILKSQETLLEDDAGNLKSKVVAKIMEGNRI